MKKTALLVIASLFLGGVLGCTPQTTGEPGAPSEHIEETLKEEFTRTEFKVNIVLHENESAVKRAYEKWMGRENLRRLNLIDAKYTLYGFAVWTLPPQEPACTINVVRPKGVNDKRTTTWGHELQHCVYGRYHASGF
jgi:hypothetical protein